LQKYGEARYRDRLGFTPLVKSFEEMARVCIKDMQQDLRVSTGKKIYTTYIAVIETYFIPLFEQHYLTCIKSNHIAELEAWRDTKIHKPLKSLTLLILASTFQRIKP